MVELPGDGRVDVLHDHAAEKGAAGEIDELRGIGRRAGWRLVGFCALRVKCRVVRALQRNVPGRNGPARQFIDAEDVVLRADQNRQGEVTIDDQVLAPDNRTAREE